MNKRLSSNIAALCLTVIWATVPSGVATATAPGPGVRTVSVDCSAGDTVTEALKLPAHELTVEISGLCVEDVVIDRDRVTLIGVTPDAGLRGSRTTPGPIVLIRGASAISLQDLLITGGETIGMRIQRNGEARLRNVQLTETPFFGLLIDEASSALLADTVVADHGLFGVVLFGASGLTIEGTVDVSRNGQVGLLMSSGASLHANGVGQLTANDNGSFGLFLQAGSKGLFPSVQARNNGVAGLNMNFGGEFFSIGVNEFSNNGVFGITLGDGARYFAAGEVLNNGSVGVFAEEASHVNVATDVPSRIGGSPVAVILEGATGTFGGTTQEIGTVVIEGTLELAFGSRASFGADVTLEALVCDGTVLTQGAISCPSSLGSATNTSVLGGENARLRHDLPPAQRLVLPSLP